MSSQEVTEFIERIQQPWQGEIAARIRARIREEVPDVEERLQYRKPHFLKNGKYLAVLGTAKGWVSFTIFNAQELDAPDGLFEADGPPERKTVKIKDGQEIDVDLVGRLVAQAASTL